MPARQVEAAREHIARVRAAIPRVAIALWPTRVVAVTVVSPLACLMTIIVAVAAVVMLLYARRTRFASKRLRIVVMIPVVLVPIAWVSRIA